MRLVLATGNLHKVQEMQALARATDGPVEEILPAQAVGGMPAVVEDAGTFVGNARLKARALHARVRSAAQSADLWVLADDSGLCVDALAGGPGVESAYYAGRDATGAQNLAKLVSTLRNVTPDRRGAHFVCVLVLVAPDGGEQVFEGRCDGRLLPAPAGGGGFGYDPLFVPDGENLSFAELGDEVKNRLSHRARAWRQLAGSLRRH